MRGAGEGGASAACDGDAGGCGTAGCRWFIWATMAGLWRSVDGVNQQGTRVLADDATHFQNLNGGLGSLAEVVSFAQDPSDCGNAAGGAGREWDGGDELRRRARRGRRWRRARAGWWRSIRRLRELVRVDRRRG